MNSNDDTLPESGDETLVAYAHRDDPASAAVVLAALDDPRARRRVLALRAAHRRGLIDEARRRRSLADVDADLRREALAMIAEIDIADASLTAAVVNCLDDADPLVVDAAAFCCGELAVRDAVEVLVRVATSHEDARCREAAIAALGAIGDDRARGAIVAALDDKPPVRRRAIVALANFEGPDIDAALERAREDRDWQVRAAVDQLGRDENE